MNIVELSGRKKDKLIQFAKNLEDVPEKKLVFPMLWSKKIDGVYCLAVRTFNKVIIYSRTGEVYTSMKHIEDELFKVMFKDDVIIFEAHSAHTNKQSIVSGWARDTKQQHPKLMASCHDLLNLEEFMTGGLVEYRHRHSMLFRLMHRYSDDTCLVDKSIVTICSQQCVYTLKEALKLTELVWTHGGEGAVLRNPNGLYAPGKRNEDIIKIKEKITLDLEVIGIFEGKGKYVGMLGGIVCKYADDKTVSVGSGFTDDERRFYRSSPDSIIGQIVEVEAMKESDKGKLREPRFKGVRHDKLKGDY